MASNQKNSTSRVSRLFPRPAQPVPAPRKRLTKETFEDRLTPRNSPIGSRTGVSRY